MKREISFDDLFEIHRRQIVLSDGRYLIFYTFGPKAQFNTGDESSPQNSEKESSGEAHSV